MPADWPDAYAHPQLVQQMSTSAFLVFQACVDGQLFAREEES